MSYVVPNEKVEEFYNCKLIDKNSYDYLLSPSDLKKLGYEQHFIENSKGVVLRSTQYYTDAEINKLLANDFSIDNVYRHPGRGGAFGDSFGWASFIYRLSEAHGNKKIKVTEIHPKCFDMVRDILQTTGQVEVIKKEQDTKVTYLPGGTKGGYRFIYSQLFLPSKFKWQNNKSKKVGYQFGKRGLADRRIQDPQDELLIINTLKEVGYEPIEMGGFLGNEACAKIASEVQFFVGTCSGMSHLCHSVGTPVHMITNLRTLERVSVGHVKNSRSPIPTVFWQHPHHFVEFLKNDSKKT
jgi:hypothetical protein